MPKITMIMDGNFNRFEGEVYSPHMSYDKFAKRFSDEFDEVSIVARSFPKDTKIGQVVTGKKVSFIDLGDSRGIYDYLNMFWKRVSVLTSIIKKSDVVLIRMPGNISTLAVLLCIFLRKPYHIEVVADPVQYFSGNVSKSKFRKIFQRVHVLAMKVALSRSKSVRYVTSHYLQELYPAKKGVASFGFSDVHLQEEYHGNYRAGKGDIKLLSVAMMHDNSKGHRDMIDLLKLLNDNGGKFSLTLIGDGALKSEFKEYSSNLGVSQSIEFAGLKNASEIREYMSDNHIFLLSSYQEGMPRALLEALSFGMPVVSSDVGGVYEVLAKNYLFPCGNILQAKNLIHNLISEGLEDVSKRNLVISKQFIGDEIKSSYADYFNFLKLSK